MTLLNIDRENSEEKKLMEELNDYVTDNIYAGINRKISFTSNNKLEFEKRITAKSSVKSQRILVPGCFGGVTSFFVFSHYFFFYS